MNQEKFIQAIKLSVEKGSINAVIKSLMQPAGRTPEKSLSLLSEWFNRLDEEDRLRITEIVSLAVKQSIFGFLCVIDGVTSIKIDQEDDEPEIKLTATHFKNEVVLNNPNDDFLHDLYKSL